ncbi:Sec20-domain-containing protein [Mycena maculata]|uniref:Sec20-domain-containing protein n=1 Tax=Mycena maculata TaxID=230809 RepID=A0AAD7HVA2_9AGAR|nr:Sec20-domain-containing protein [Mycena maculata]
MPPLPSTFDEETLQLVAAAQRRETDLADFQIPRLRTCQGPLSLQQNLAAELREDIDTFARQIEALDILVDDQKGSKNRRELRGIVDGFNETLASLRRNARAALLASKRTIGSLSKSQREELLNSSAVSEKRDLNEKVTDDALMAAKDNVTEAMQRTLTLLQGELERSVLSSQMLADSTATLRTTSSTHDTLTSVMDTSKHLITALNKADRLDRVLIFAALLFFILVVLFILKQRLFDRAMRAAFWWTRFIPDFGGDAQSLNMDKSSATALSTTLITSSAAYAASVLTSSSNILDSPSGTIESTPEISLDTTVESVIQATTFSPETETASVSATSSVPEQTMHVEL